MALGTCFTSIKICTARLYTQDTWMTSRQTPLGPTPHVAAPQMGAHDFADFEAGSGPSAAGGTRWHHGAAHGVDPILGCSG